ncbi:MAG: RDD family protein [Sphingobacteriaceae bacterium]|nr:MAG: RDD family protein [Sphingobacteriaceae bacterium]
MQTIRITTSQNIDIDYEIAGVGERILAYLIDAAIFVLIYIAIGVTGVVTGRDITLIVSIIVLLVLYVFYDLVCEIFMNGQSVGKRIMKIKVISLDGGQPTIGQYMLRWLFRIVDFTLTSGLCAVISTSVSKNSQRVGDMVAGTTLIKTTSRTQIDAIAFTPPDENYKVVFTQVTQLTDKDIVLIHEVLANYIKYGNYEMLAIAAAKLKELLHIMTDMDDVMFLNTLVRDYNHTVASAQLI